MTQYLPPNLLALFAPRDPLPFLPPADKLPHEKKTRGYIGVGNFLGQFEDPKDTPPPTRVETREERLERRRKEKAEQVAYKLEREIAIWDPQKLDACTEDPFKTLFVARINYDTSESKLRREFETYGPIKKIIVINNPDTTKPRGYAFIEYEHERDMHSAYKHADGKKIDGKRVLVDVERARTVKGWLPRRLGGGLGGTRRGGPEVNIKHSGREDNERERERYRLEREREDRGMERGGGGAGGGRPDFRDRGDRGSAVGGNMFGGDRRRSRSPRIDRRERDRSRHRSRSPRADRKKRRSSRDRNDDDGASSAGDGERGSSSRRERRDRSERAGDKEKSKRSKRSRSRERGSKRDKRDKERGLGERKEKKPDFREGDIKIKEEPVDDYPDYSTNFANYGGADVKYEEGEEKKFRPTDMDRERESGGGHGGGGGGGGGHKNPFAQQQQMLHEDGEYDDRYA